MLKRDSILKGFSFRFSPAHVRDPFAQKSNHKRVFTFDFFGIDGEELRDSIRYDLLELRTGHRLEAA